MKPHLLWPDADFDPNRKLPWNAQALVSDLSIDTILATMARDDAVIRNVAKKVILCGANNDPETIRHRQGVLADCLGHPAVVRELYAVAGGAVEKQRKHWLGSLDRHPDWVLRHGVELMEMFLGELKALRRISDTHAAGFVSPGWRTLHATLRQDLSDEYLAEVRRHLEQLRFRRGVVLAARLGPGNKGDDYVLCRPRRRPQSWLERLTGPRPPGFTFTLAPRDDGGFRALSELRDRGIGSVARALGQSAWHVRDFFAALRSELAFYVGCLNLHERLTQKGEPACFPVPEASDAVRLSFHRLYDIGLALNTTARVTGNEANADGRDLVIVMGANQGGKTTFLRSLGLAQLMLQAGMFVGAEAFRSSLCGAVFTHFRREEDAGMESGKLDEELARMSDIVDRLRPRSLVLSNESFATTNEREGSEIARQVISALVDTGNRVVCVTHLHELARLFHQGDRGNVLFLQAERREDGARTFRLIEGPPLMTSFGEDLYRSVFGENGPAPAASATEAAARVTAP